MANKHRNSGGSEEDGRFYRTRLEFIGLFNDSLPDGWGWTANFGNNAG